MAEFSFQTVNNFDQHINNSIAGYSDLVEDVLKISDYFVEDGMKSYDLGCSTGSLIKRLSVRHPKSFFVGIDKEDNFSKDFTSSGNYQLIKRDLMTIDNFSEATFITSLFTMQFLSERDRTTIIDRVYKSLQVGGCFLWCEKILSNNPKFQDILSFIYYDRKREKFTDTEILDKERSLRKIMKSLTLEDNFSILNRVGFSRYEIFWRRYNFVGIIAIK